MLLDLDLLELDKLGAARLETQTSTALVHLTILRLAHLDGHEAGPVYWLIGLGTAAIARVRGHLEHGLDFNGADDNSLDVHELANAASFDLTD